MNHQDCRPSCSCDHHLGEKIKVQHIFRKNGQSRKCCPKNFYSDIYDHDYVTSHNTSINEVDFNMVITENELQKNEVKKMTRNDIF